MMHIAGFQKLTLLDYPGKVACTVFTPGCSFRCPFCHNASLVLPGRDRADIPREQVQQHLAAARAFLREQAQQHQLDAFAFYNDQGCAVPCVAGAPMVTVPFGKNQFEEPVGATFVGLPDTDQALMNLALAFEQGSSMRQIPTGYLDHQ